MKYIKTFNQEEDYNNWVNESTEEEYPNMSLIKGDNERISLLESKEIKNSEILK